jgi:plasmid stabilization system protein ParE
VATVVFDRDAVRDLEAMISSHDLPGSTKHSVRDSASQLATFPLSGRRLTGEGAGARFILGPWPWMILVYDYNEAADRVEVVAIEDARRSSASTQRRA